MNSVGHWKNDGRRSPDRNFTASPASAVSSGRAYAYGRPNLRPHTRTAAASSSIAAIAKRLPVTDLLQACVEPRIRRARHDHAQRRAVGGRHAIENVAAGGGLEDGVTRTSKPPHTQLVDVAVPRRRSHR